MVTPILSSRLRCANAPLEPIVRLVLLHRRSARARTSGFVYRLEVPALPPPWRGRQIQSSCFGALLQKRSAARSFSSLALSPASLVWRVASTLTTVSGLNCQRAPVRIVRFPAFPSVMPA